MKKNSWVALILSFVLVVGLLAACGGNNQQDNGKGNNNTNTSDSGKVLLEYK